MFCDCDGTITRVDAAETVMETFALPVWRGWKQRWVNGEITIQKFLSRRNELIRADRDTRIEFAADLAIDEDIIPLDRRCAEHGTSHR